MIYKKSARSYWLHYVLVVIGGLFAILKDWQGGSRVDAVAGILIFKLKIGYKILFFESHKAFMLADFKLKRTI